MESVMYFLLPVCQLCLLMAPVYNISAKPFPKLSFEQTPTALRVIVLTAEERSTSVPALDTVAYAGSAVLPQSELVIDWHKPLNP